MQINITARHMKLTKGLSDYVQKRTNRLSHYAPSRQLIRAQVKLDVEKYRQIAEIIIYGERNTFRAKESTRDLYSSIDLVVDKLGQQIRRYKEKLKLHRPVYRQPGTKQVREPSKESIIPPKLLSQAITAVSEIEIKPITVREAISKIKLLGHRFYLFFNIDTEKINIIYTRDDGSYGLIEPK